MFTVYAQKRLFSNFRSKIWPWHSLRRPRLRVHFRYRMTCGIYLMFSCKSFICPCELDLRHFDLGGVRWIKLHTSNARTIFKHSTIIRSRVMGDSIWSHYHHMELSLRMRLVTWPITGGGKWCIVLKSLTPICLFILSLPGYYDEE